MFTLNRLEYYIPQIGSQRDHPFKTSAFLGGGGVSPLPIFADTRGVEVSPLPTFAERGRGLRNLPTS